VLQNRGTRRFRENRIGAQNGAPAGPSEQRTPTTEREERPWP
jgi:hypothetical protein